MLLSQTHPTSNCKNATPRLAKSQAGDRFRSHLFHTFAVGFDAQPSLQVARPAVLIQPAELLHVAVQRALHLLLLAAAKQLFCGGVEEDSGQTSLFEQCGIVRRRKSPTPQSHDLDGTAQFVDQRRRAACSNWRNPVSPDCRKICSMDCCS